jgi:hypothetical protein
MPHDCKPSPLTAQQRELLDQTIRMVEEIGFGEVSLVIENGHVRFIRPSYSIDMRRPDVDPWIRRDQLENLPK